MVAMAAAMPLAQTRVMPGHALSVGHKKSLRPFGMPLRRTLHLCSATDDEPSKEQEGTPAPAPIPPKVTPIKDPETESAQRTAIVTGAISVIFGVAYLVLVQFMDMRGGELLPPPPEAYIP